MRATKTAAALAAVLAMAEPALAATSLCAEDVVSGLVWQEGAWKPPNFQPIQYVIRSVEPREQIWNTCGANLVKKGLSEEPVVEGAFSSWWGCYGMADVGTELTAGDVTYCKVLASAEGIPFSVNCDDALWSLYFQPTGEFQVTRSKEARVNFGGDAGPRATMTVSAGKCTVIAP